MDSNSLRQYALERATGLTEVFYSTRLLGAVVLLLAICGASGCIATQLKETSSRPVEAGMEVFVHAAIGQHTMDRICIFPFSAPPEMAAASDPLTIDISGEACPKRPFSRGQDPAL